MLTPAGFGRKVRVRLGPLRPGSLRGEGEPGQFNVLEREGCQMYDYVSLSLPIIAISPFMIMVLYVVSHHI